MALLLRPAAPAVHRTGFRFMLELMLLVVALIGAANPAAGQPPSDSVPFIVTPMAVVWEMLRLGRVGADDVVYDLGSGDGRIPIAAARYLGARGTGFEIDSALIRQSWSNAAAAGVEDRVSFVNRDLFTADLRPASVVTLYLSPEFNRELRPRLLSVLRPGTRVVSHAFHMGDWVPDSVVHVGEGFGRATLYLWVVPAQVDGFWQLVLDSRQGEQAYVLELLQRYQQLSGEARREGRALEVGSGRLDGEQISFTLAESGADGRQALSFRGQLGAGVLEGTYLDPQTRERRRWRATRFTRASEPADPPARQGVPRRE